MEWRWNWAVDSVYLYSPNGMTMTENGKEGKEEKFLMWWGKYQPKKCVIQTTKWMYVDKMK